MKNTPDLLALLRLTRTISGADLLARLQKNRPTLSRATLMRMVKALGEQVVVRGAARRTTYAARRPIRGSSRSIPLYLIDINGRGSEIASIDPVYPNGCAVRFTTSFTWPLTPEMADGWFPGLPYPLDDMRPQGFLGRHFAHAYATLLQVPEDPQKWQEDDVLYVLSTMASDSLGNYILGEQAYRRHLDTVQRGYPTVSDEGLALAYPALAVTAMAAGVAGSSAGGEFPKFTACRERAGQKTHVIVKFSGNDDTPGVQRWSDLLVCEHLALHAVAQSLALAAARSQIHQVANRTFLEVERFDRHGEFGRSSVCTWAALEAALFGMAGASWSSAAVRLRDEGLISATTASDIASLWHFGRLIGNTDMHEGNLAFEPASSAGGELTLAPAYDMLPMLYAPVRGVELPLRKFAPALPLPNEYEVWRSAAAAAIEFWQSAGCDVRISADFRAVCRENGQEVERLVGLIG